MDTAESPALSVIMPAFNCEPYIAEALASIFSQGVENLEVVVVDDGSTDKTATIASAFDPRVKVFRSSGLGPAGARNLAVKNSTGALLSFLDADDVWLPGKLLAQMAFLKETPEARIVFAGHIFWHANGDGDFAAAHTVPWNSVEGLNHERSGWIYPEMLLDSQIHIITAVCHRSVYDAVGGFDGTFGKGSDYDFWIKATHLFPAYRLARDGALYRIHDASITMRKSEICAQYEIVNRAIATYGYDAPNGRKGDQIKIRRRLADVCFAHAYSHFFGGNPRVAATFFGKAINLGRTDVKTRIYWLAATLKTGVVG